MYCGPPFNSCKIYECHACFIFEIAYNIFAEVQIPWKSGGTDGGTEGRGEEDAD